MDRRQRHRRLIVSLVGIVAVSACNPASNASQGASRVPSLPSISRATSTPAPDRTAVPGFEDWQLINPQGVRVSVDDGALVMELIGGLIWFNADRGVLFYRDVTGDFRATATVRTARTSNASEPPGQDGTVQLAGLMARTEVPAENSVFIVTGSIGDSTGLETKTTESSRSIYIQRAQPTGGDAELQLCRHGSTFSLSWRHVDSDEDWMHMSTFDRKDMPATLQVGANIYTDAVPDITARFDDLTVEPLQPGAGC
jgi:hypothetical protein